MMTLLLLLNPRDPRHLQLLTLARKLLEEGRTDLAVVTAQTACEVYAEVAIREMLKARELGEFEDVIPELLSGYSLMDHRGRRVFQVLTGEGIQRSELWASYQVHVKLRNRIVHGGEEATAEQAADSIAVAEAFHEYVATVWEAAASIDAKGPPGAP